MAPLLLVLARPLVERVARRIAARGSVLGAVDGARVFWLSVALIAPLFLAGEVDGFFRSFTWAPWLTLGYVGLGSIDHLLGWGILLASPVAGLVAFVVGRVLGSFADKPLPPGTLRVRGSTLSWLLILACLVPVPMGVQRAMIAPQAADYEARLTRLGTVPPVAMPTQPDPPPRSNPNGYDVYPSAFDVPDLGDLHARRYCGQHLCVTYLARHALPDRNDEGLMPSEHWSLYDRGEGFQIMRDPEARLLVSRRLDGQYDVVDSGVLGYGFLANIHVRLTERIAPPWSLVLVPILGVAFATFIMLRARGAPRTDLRDARIDDDGLVHFDDGTAPARPPAGTPAMKGPVLVRLLATGASTFRETGAAEIIELFPGGRADLAHVEDLRAQGKRAFALAIALLLTTPLVAAAIEGLC